MSDAKIIWAVCVLGAAALAGGVGWAIHAATPAAVAATPSPRLPSDHMLDPALPITAAVPEPAQQLADVRQQEKDQEAKVADLSAKLDIANESLEASRDDAFSVRQQVATLRQQLDLAKRQPADDAVPVGTKGGSCGNGYTFANVKFLPGYGEGSRFVGEVHNGSGRNDDFVNLTITVYAADGSVSDSETVIVRNIDDGITKTFEGQLLKCDLSSISSFKVQFDSSRPRD